MGGLHSKTKKQSKTHRLWQKNVFTDSDIVRSSQLIGELQPHPIKQYYPRGCALKSFEHDRSGPRSCNQYCDCTTNATKIKCIIKIYPC